MSFSIDGPETATGDDHTTAVRPPPALHLPTPMRRRRRARGWFTAAAIAATCLVATPAAAAPTTSTQAVGATASRATMTTDDVLGATISHPPTWRAAHDTVLFETYGLRLIEESAAPSAHSHRTAARVAVHYSSTEADLDRIVAAKLAEYPGVPIRRWNVRLAGGRTGTALGPIPGGQVSVNVYTPANGKVYQIDYYGERLDADARALLAGLRFTKPTASVDSLRLTPVEQAIRRQNAPAQAAKRGSGARPTVGVAAGEYRLPDGCWTQPTWFYIQTSHGPYANSSTRYPGWSQMGTPNFWGQRTHGNLGYGKCAHTYYTNDYYAIDYYLGYGDALYAPFAEGYVTYAGWDQGNWYDYGVMVVIQSPNGKYWSLSAHLDSVNVWAGQYVTDQTLIGWADSTGYADPYPHLHQAFYRYAQTSYGRPYGGQGLKQTALTYLSNGGGVYTSFAKYKWVSW